VLYRIDNDDRLAGYDPAFRHFATANGAPDLPEQWLGRSLWDATGSSEINMVFRSLIGRARQGCQVRVPSRCDTPSLTRFIEIEIVADAQGHVAFTSRLTRARFKRELAAEASTAHEPLRMCASCFRVEAGGWHDAEQVVAERGLLLGDVVPDVTHGTCPDC
jgi:hypothetical protein